MRRYRVPRALLQLRSAGSPGRWLLAARRLGRGRLGAAPPRGLRGRRACAAKTGRDQQQLAALAGELRALEEQLAAPGGVRAQGARDRRSARRRCPEAVAPAQLGAARVGEGGQGGGEEPEDGAAAPDVSAPRRWPAAEPARRAAPARLGLDDAALQRIQREGGSGSPCTWSGAAGAFEELIAALRRRARPPRVDAFDLAGRRLRDLGLRLARARPSRAGVSLPRGPRHRGGAGQPTSWRRRAGAWRSPARRGPLGQTVVLDHGHGFRTIYGHASALYVHAGPARSSAASDSRRSAARAAARGRTSTTPSAVKGPRRRPRGLHPRLSRAPLLERISRRGFAPRGPLPYISRHPLSGREVPASQRQPMWNVLRKVFGSKNDRELKRIVPLVERVNRLEAEYATLSDAALRAKTADVPRAPRERRVPRRAAARGLRDGARGDEAHARPAPLRRRS